MTDLISSVENAEDEALLVALAKRFNAPIMRKPGLSPRPDAVAMIRALNKITATGGLTYISDPVAWQQQTRQDRAFPFPE